MSFGGIFAGNPQRISTAIREGILAGISDKWQDEFLEEYLGEKMHSRRSRKNAEILPGGIPKEIRNDSF